MIGFIAAPALVVCWAGYGVVETVLLGRGELAWLEYAGAVPLPPVGYGATAELELGKPVLDAPHGRVT